MWRRIQRTFKHRWLSPATMQLAIAPDMLGRLAQRVAASEQRHSGEIRICVEAGLPLSYVWRDASIRQITRQRAIAMFGKLRVWDTAHNNGVLIYLLLAERSIELVADRGLNDLVAPDAWQAMLLRMRGAFQQGQFEDGLSQALEQITALLVEHFALAPGQLNPNELPDAPVLN